MPNPLRRHLPTLLLPLLLGACGRIDLTDARQAMYGHEGQTFESRCTLADDGQSCQDLANNPDATVPLLPPASYGLLTQLRKGMNPSPVQLPPTADTLAILARQVTIVSRRIDPPSPTSDGKGKGTLVFLWTYNAPR